jgi:5-methylcytosine-specific restriction enzyme A
MTPRIAHVAMVGVSRRPRARGEATGYASGGTLGHARSGTRRLDARATRIREATCLPSLHVAIYSIFQADHVLVGQKSVSCQRFGRAYTGAGSLMPARPLRVCRHRECYAATRADTPYCAQHQAGRSASWRAWNDGRTSTERGYGADWRPVRDAHIRTYPLCGQAAPDAYVGDRGDCVRDGCVTAATQVHHLLGFAGVDDPLRLDRRNLCSICGAAIVAPLAALVRRDMGSTGSPPKRPKRPLEASFYRADRRVANERRTPQEQAAGPPGASCLQRAPTARQRAATRAYGRRDAVRPYRGGA